jgi:uncharacterized protein YkwD
MIIRRTLILRSLALVWLLTASAFATATADDEATDGNPYVHLTRDEFLKLERLDEQIDFTAIDYALVQAAVFHLTNQERVQAGSEPLTYFRGLEQAAMAHSHAMKERGFYSHRSPVAGMERVPDRYAAFGFSAGGWGENINLIHGIEYQSGRGVYSPAQNGGYFSYEYRGDPIPPRTYLRLAEEAVRSWMASSGHRRNILNPSFRYLGVGAAHFTKASFHDIDSFYFTQNFAVSIQE